MASNGAMGVGSCELHVEKEMPLTRPDVSDGGTEGTHQVGNIQEADCVDGANELDTCVRTDDTRMDALGTASAGGSIGAPGVRPSVF